MASTTTVNVDGELTAVATLRCWGDFVIADTASGADQKPRGRKARALLAYLALHPGKQISRERLTGLLWGDRAEEQARASLRQSILELKAFTTGARSLLTVERDSIVLDPTALATDIGTLEDAARTGAFDAFLQALPERDDLLFANLDNIDPGFDDWLVIERTRQRDALTALVANASAAALASGDIGTARALHIRLVELDDECETAPAWNLGQQLALSESNDNEASQAVLSQPESGRRGRRRIALLVALLLTISIFAIDAWQVRREEATSSTTIAVLPFKDMAGRGNAYFAEGLSEEILGQLARNPRLKVMGRTSAWSFKNHSLDAPTLGRKLDVAYLVEGSVRRAGVNIRVNVALVRAKDGAQMWSERYDGPLDDVFAIQERIGAAVAGRLDAGQPVRQASVTRGDVYTLYLIARGLMREGTPASLGTAVSLLRQAVKLDPRFAPAWARLGGAVAMHGKTLNEVTDSDSTTHLQEGERLVRRALALQPDLAEAHGALGMILDFQSPEAGAHIKHAVRLNPNDAQSLFWLGNVHGADGDYTKQLIAWRRSVAIDPLWHRPANAATIAAWEMGYRNEALRYVQRAERDSPLLGCYMNVELARSQGNFSRMVKDVAKARAALEAPAEADSFGGFALLALGQTEAARVLLRLPPDMWQVVSGAPLPSAEGVIRAYSDRSLSYLDAYYLPLLLRRLLDAGRAPEIVSLYDSKEGALSSVALIGRGALTEFGPSVALALGAVGRDAEGARLLARADAEVRRSMAMGRVPNRFQALAAETWSVQGKRNEALTALEAAANSGWHYVSMTPRSDIADIPAFRVLRSDPRFERVRTRLRAHIERERRELGTLTI